MLRMTRVLASALTAPQIDLTESVTLSFRALPSDCDANLHVNNANYLRLMDLGRLALVARLGLLGPMVKNRWGAIVGGVELEFLREIPLMAPFDLTTRVVGWDKKWVYMEQRFELDGRTAAIGRVQGLFRGKRSIPVAEVLAELGPWLSSPGLPPEFRKLAERAPLRPGVVITQDDLPGLGFAA